MAASQASRAVGPRACGLRDPRSLLYALADAQLFHLRTSSHPAEGPSASSAPSVAAVCAHSRQCVVHAGSGTEAPHGPKGATSGVPCASRGQLDPRADEQQRSASGRAPEAGQRQRQHLLRAWAQWRELQTPASGGLHCLPQGCLLAPGAPAPGGWAASACRPLSGSAAARALPPEEPPIGEDSWRQTLAGGGSLELAQEGSGDCEPELEGRSPRHGLRRPRPAPEEEALESQRVHEAGGAGADLDARAEDGGPRHQEPRRERGDGESRLLVEERQDLRRRQELRRRMGQPGEVPSPVGTLPQHAGSWGLDSSARTRGQLAASSQEHMAAPGAPPGSSASPWPLGTGGASEAAPAGGEPAEPRGSALLPGAWWAEPQEPWLLQDPGLAARPALALPGDQRFLRVAVVGAPNAGKSSLVNCLVNARVSAVSRKTNTTTKEVLGISTEGNIQLVFHDTPGLLQEVSGRPLSYEARASAKAAMSVMDRCQVLAMVVDAERQIRRPDPRVQRWAYRLGGAPTWDPESAAGAVGASPMGGPQDPGSGQSLGEGSPCPGPQTRILVLNKVDAVRDKKLLLPLAAHYGHLRGFQRTFMVSARKGKGVDHLKAFLEDMAVAEPWEEDPGRRTDQAVEELAMQMVRQALLNRLHQELPYRIQQQHVGTATLSDGSVRLEQRLLVETLNQRGILLGNQGHNIREIGTVARKHVEEVLGRRVHLILDVKVARK